MSGQIEVRFSEFHNNAKKVLEHRVDLNASEEARRAQIETIVGVFCPFLKPRGGDRPLQIKPLTGGLSNHLFVVSNDEDSGASCDGTAETEHVLVRIHPDSASQSTDDNERKQEKDGFCIVDRDLDAEINAWLASQIEDLPHNRGNIAPAMYGRFENGRVEEFFLNVRPLAWAEMATYAPWIAQSMASFHSLESPPEDVLPRPPTDDDGKPRGVIYNRIRSWLEGAYELKMDDATTEFLNELSKEWDWLEPELSKPPKQRTTVVNPVLTEALDLIRRVTITHMDCHPLNILVDRKDPKEDCDDPVRNLNTLRLIDFEFCGWNPIAADIANTFCEHCEMSNLRADYDKEYPTPDQQDEFFWNYLLQSNPARAKQFSSYSWRQEGKSNEAKSDDDDIEWQLFSATLQKEVGRFSLLSHLGWAIWAIFTELKTEEADKIDFDYMHYARHRMDGYSWAKKKFFSTVDNS
mmetsp:Transcript_23822/g.56315  ORF Transcript_23822/g.56315 Transcript_23822/m.56315 type:complete len:465 (+) Transcript_23822:114-1508(+)